MREPLLIVLSIASVPHPPWHPSPAHHFLYSVLNLVVKHVLPSDPTPRDGIADDQRLPPAVVWRFSFIPRRGCELYRATQVDRVDERWGGVLKEKYVRWKMGQR